jgi:cytochrome c oxidase subunit 3
MTSAETTTRQAQTLGAKATLWIVLASETALFATLVMSYLFLRSGQTNWPFLTPSLARLALPAFNTGVLILSAILAWRAGLAIQHGNVPRLKFGLSLVCALGLLFIGGQTFEFTRSGMRPDDPAFGGVFLALMGFHAVHVLAGMIVFGLNLLRTQLGDFNKNHHLAVDLSIQFWVYVTAIWLVLFSVLYLV